ncbi:MAG: DUF4157 domain-containing protein, partial [Gemmatimonadota bacterium]|nr:DUF4157 domain-containing protein [Gemmatimonadota bacterium]
MGISARLLNAVAGRRIELPPAFTDLYPELADVSYRRGGLPVRVAGWALGSSSAAAITLWRTVFISPAVPLSTELLLHELRHVHQFLERKTFPLSYLWQSLRYGYSRNAYEIDARRYSALRL